MKNVLKIIWKGIIVIATVWGAIDGIISLIGWTKNKISISDFLKEIDLTKILSVIQIIGTIIIIAAILVFIVMKILKRYEPKRGLADIIAPILLPPEEIGDTEGRFQKRWIGYRLIQIGVTLLIVGFVSTLLVRYWGALFA